MRKSNRNANIGEGGLGVSLGRKGEIGPKTHYQIDIGKIKKVGVPKYHIRIKQILWIPEPTNNLPCNLVQLDILQYTN